MHSNPTLTANASMQTLQAVHALRTLIAAQDASGELARTLSAALSGLLQRAYCNSPDAQERYLADATSHDDLQRRRRAWAAAEERNRHLPKVW